MHKFVIHSLLLSTALATAVHAAPPVIGQYQINHEFERVSPKGIRHADHTGAAVDYLKITGAAALQAQGHTGAGTKAIVIDDCINPQHPALSTNLTDSCVPGNYRPYLSRIESGHGTHVAGLIRNMAPDAQIKFIGAAELCFARAKRVFKTQLIKDALRNAARSEGDVVNISLGLLERTAGHYQCSFMDELQAVTDSGKIIFWAIGNEGGRDRAMIQKEIEMVNDPRFKGRIVLVNSSSYDGNDRERLSSFSDYPIQPTLHAMTAPGHEIFAPYKGGYRAISGTSMASPITAGSFLLLKSALEKRYGKKSFTNDEILSYLKISSRKKSLNDTVTFDDTYGHGILDVQKAFERAIEGRESTGEAAKMAHKAQMAIANYQADRKAKAPTIPAMPQIAVPGQAVAEAPKAKPQSAVPAAQQPVRPEAVDQEPAPVQAARVPAPAPQPEPESWSSYLSNVTFHYVTEPIRRNIVAPIKSFFGW